MKLGAIFIVAIMALAAAGAGYAMWSETLTIEGTVNTGSFMIGVRDDGTGDPGPNYLMGGELFPDVAYPETQGTADPQYDPGHNEEGKNVASTESVNPITTPYFTKDVGGAVDVPFWQSITENVYNAYPWYSSWIEITFANAGTVPAKIHDGRWIAPSDPDGLLPFLVFDNCEIYKEGTLLGEVADLNGFQYQLDPCNTITFRIYFHFKEFIDQNDNGLEDEGEPIMPQNANLGFTYQIIWAQWNEVSGTPWTPPTPPTPP